MTSSITRLGRAAAVAAAVSGVVYSIAFTVVVQRGARWAEWTAAVALTTGGLLAVVALVAVTSMLAEAPSAAGTARLTMLIGGIAGVMTALHGAYDLAGLADATAATAGDISPVDPRGFATFALAGLTMLLLAAGIGRDDRFPRWLPAVGVLLGIALITTWLGRLVVVDPTSAWLRITTSAAAVLNPIVYVGFAAALRPRPVRAERWPVAA
jgi:hypothetical protein